MEKGIYNESVTFNGKFFTATGDLGVSKLRNYEGALDGGALDRMFEAYR